MYLYLKISHVRTSMDVEVESCIQSHYMNSTIWTPMLGGVFICEREMNNTKDYLLWLGLCFPLWIFLKKQGFLFVLTHLRYFQCNNLLTYICTYILEIHYYGTPHKKFTFRSYGTVVYLTMYAQGTQASLRIFDT